LQIKILVLTDVLRVPHADPSVQESAYLGQQLLLQCNLANGQVVWCVPILCCCPLALLLTRMDFQPAASCGRLSSLAACR
jgi:hypothetical protein